MEVEHARDLLAREARVASGPVVPVARVRELSIPVSGGALTARLYRPSDHAELPLLVYFHGGGRAPAGARSAQRVATRYDEEGRADRKALFVVACD